MRKTGAMPIEAYATTTWRSCTSILHTMSAPEIRRALEIEWRGGQRRGILYRLTSRLCVLTKRERVA